MKKISLALLTIFAIGAFVAFAPIDAEAKTTKNGINLNGINLNTVIANKLVANRLILNSDTMGEVTLNDKAFVGLILEK